MKSFQLFFLAVVVFNCFMFKTFAQEVDFEIDEIDTELYNENTEIETPTPLPPQVTTPSPIPMDEDVVTVYLYNAMRNKCLKTSGLPNTTVNYGDCDNSDNILWIIPSSHYGSFRSKADPNNCLTVNDGMVSLKPCDEKSVLYRKENFIKDPLSYNLCIGSLSKDSSVINTKECNIDDPDQIWYFNIWTPTSQVVETPETTVTVYLYSANKNKCLYTSGTSVFTEDCDYSDACLWTVPDTHKGYYHSNANPELCLSIVDGRVTLSECNENSVFYRNGNSIRPTLYDDKCIGSRLDNSIAYLADCEINDHDQVWFFNLYIPPTPTTTAEENVTTTITTTVTAVMTAAN